MSRKKKIIHDIDGTPIETDEDVVDETPEPEPAKPAKRSVIWTKAGEDAGVFSEHGQHSEGDVVETDHADLLIERGYAKEAE